ncbi:MAG: hypothetical protein LBB67_04925 [Oscillospiraceae bacterium]|nr:hypothetical protein [Oscillospiraceae bacterium]
MIYVYRLTGGTAVRGQGSAAAMLACRELFYRIGRKAAHLRRAFRPKNGRRMAAMPFFAAAAAKGRAIPGRNAPPRPVPPAEIALAACAANARPTFAYCTICKCFLIGT